MEKYITVFGLSVITLALIYVFTACSRVITSTPKLVTSTPSENNLYVLPKKILNAASLEQIYLMLELLN